MFHISLFRSLFSEFFALANIQKFIQVYFYLSKDQVISFKILIIFFIKINITFYISIY